MLVDLTTFETMHSVLCSVRAGCDLLTEIQHLLNQKNPILFLYKFFFRKVHCLSGFTGVNGFGVQYVRMCMNIQLCIKSLFIPELK